MFRHPLMQRLCSRRKVDKFSSYLGARNPFTKVVDPKDHIVWLFDNTAARNPRTGGWEVEFVACYFVKNSGRDLSALVADVAEKLGIGKGDKAEATMTRRLQPFADKILPAHKVNIRVGSHLTRQLGPSLRDGISNDVVQLAGDFREGDTLVGDALNVDCEEMTTFFAEPTGWAIVSDIDDTIKRTMTMDSTGILRTTFVDEPEPIPGMPELYAHLRHALCNPPFWYLSASPYNLYPFLKHFRNAYYPGGTLVLRESSWMSIAGLLRNLTVGTESYKVDRLEKIHAAFPHRRFLLIGDSTQSDPEAYGEVCRRHPEWAVKVFVRRVTDAAVDEKKNAPDRFEKAFEGVPRDRWFVFDDPVELYPIVSALQRTLA